jgi:hypothetical protein
MIIIGTEEAKDALSRYMESKFRKVKRIRNATVFTHLGMLIEVKDDGSAVRITQPKHLKELMEMMEINEKEVASTPCTDRLFKEIKGSDAKALSEEDKTKFRSILMKVGFITRTRPDVKLPFTVLTSRMQNPRKGDWFLLRRVVRYLNETRTLGIVIRPDSAKIFCSADASFAVYPDAKSHSGVIVQLGESNAPMHVSSKKQKLVAASSTEAEMIALNQATQEVIWVQDLMSELGFTMEPSVVYQDNQSCMTLSYLGPGKTARSRAISIKYFWVKQFLDEGRLVLQYRRSEDMLADGLTKPLPLAKFHEFRDQILNMSAWN